MNRLLIACAILLIAANLANAQDAFDPAAYVPASAPVYIEALLTDALDSVLAPLGIAPNAFATLTTYFLNDPAAAEAIRAFTADRAGLLMDEGRYTLLVLGVTDTDAARAFVDQQADNNTTTQLALTDAVLYIGEPEAVEAARSVRGRLSMNPAYARVMRTLPADTALRVYISADELNRAAYMDNLFPLAQDLFRLNPSQSPAELGILATAGIDGLGIAATLDGDGIIHARAALKIDAIYDAPDVPPSMLRAFIPADANAWFVSYDAAVIAIPLSLLLTTDIMNLWMLGSPSEVNITPFIESVGLAETFVGASLAELYPLINGEYAAALIISESGEMLPMFWLQTSDADRLFEIVENTSARLWRDPNGTRIFNIERAPFAGFDAITLIDFPAGLRPTIIRLNDNVIALTVDAGSERLIAAANTNVSASSSNHAAAFALNATPGFFAGTMTGALDLQADGLVLLEVRFMP